MSVVQQFRVVLFSPKFECPVIYSLPALSTSSDVLLNVANDYAAHMGVTRDRIRLLSLPVVSFFSSNPCAAYALLQSGEYAVDVDPMGTLPSRLRNCIQLHPPREATFSQPLVDDPFHIQFIVEFGSKYFFNLDDIQLLIIQR